MYSIAKTTQTDKEQLKINVCLPQERKMKHSNVQYSRIKTIPVRPHFEVMKDFPQRRERVAIAKQSTEPTTGVYQRIVSMPVYMCTIVSAAPFKNIKMCYTFASYSAQLIQSCQSTTFLHTQKR